MDKAGIAAARRGIDAAVLARSGEYAERRHADEFFSVNVDLRPRLGDDAGRGGRIDRGEVADVGQDSLRSRLESESFGRPTPADICQSTLAAVRRPLMIAATASRSPRNST